ncbi:DUF6089 family protein [Segetibacter sp.]|jgi:hypothetical protein|uniref:DUF6089 family protein n=1 Tax=Segetibacter sp. TaxID=2231182 RepID=UPI00260EB46C|nr:DUF6089 family protein [Segetibacter sp.]MCW3079958.1 hypothetical protein [Segetibacter sp.]
MKGLLAPGLSLLLMVLSEQLAGQYYNNLFSYEFGLGVGAMNCITDIGGANGDKTYYINEIRLKNTKLAFSISGSVMYQNLVGVRVEGTWGAVGSADRDIDGTTVNAKSKAVRNLSFRSKISEISLLAEFHPLLLFDYAKYPPLSPYVVAGVGRFSFNPQAFLHNRYIDLEPLHTEGQGFFEYNEVQPYLKSQFNIPVGLGLRYEASDVLNLRLEFHHRILFTDYLDDAHCAGFVDAEIFRKYLSVADAANAQKLFNRSLDGSLPARRANPKNNDAYMSVSLKVGLVLRRKARY